MLALVLSSQLSPRTPTSRSDDLITSPSFPAFFVVVVVVVVVISDASQTLRVGYGRFVSDLLGHVENARARAGTRPGTGAPTGTAEVSGGTVRTARQRAEKRGEQQPRVENGTKTETETGTRTTGDLQNPGGLAGGGPAAGAASSTTGAGAEATALGGLQRFGGECLRSLAEGAAFA